MTPYDLALACERVYNVHTREADGAEAAIFDEGKGPVVAFRGTEADFGDILKDMRFFPWYDSELGALCHSGFLKSARALYPVLLPDVAAYVLQGRKLYLTGHSLGAAQATIFACLLRRNFSSCDIELIGFGSPPVQYGYGLDKWLRDIPVTLYRNGGDCVTRHPLLGRHVRRLTEIGPLESEGDIFLDHRIGEYIRSLGGGTI